jgi:hypothetical protein
VDYFASYTMNQSLGLYKQISEAVSKCIIYLEQAQEKKEKYGGNTLAPEIASARFGRPQHISRC